MEQALKVLGTAKEETLMVGDYYDTDILAGMNTGMDTFVSPYRCNNKGIASWL